MNRDERALAIRRIEYRLAVACGQESRTNALMLLSIAGEINEVAIYRRGQELRDEYLALRDEYTGQPVLAPYIWADLGRREFQGELVNSAEHKKLIAEAIEEINGRLGYWRRVGKYGLGEAGVQLQDTEWWTSWGRFETKSPSKSIRAIPIGGATEVDIAQRHYRERPKPKTWDEARARHDARGRHYLRGGTAGRARPRADMTIIKELLQRFRPRERAVYRDLILTEPPRSRAEIARDWNIRHLNQVSQILKRAERKMKRWLLEIEQNPKSVTPPTR